MKRVVEGVIVGLVLGAIGASAKSIIDVAELKIETKTHKELLQEVRADVKAIREKVAP